MFYAPIDDTTYEHLRNAEAWLDRAENLPREDRIPALVEAQREMSTAETYIGSGMTAAQRAEDLKLLQERERELTR